MLFRKESKYRQTVTTQLLNGLPVFIGNLSLQVWGLSGNLTEVTKLDTQLIRFTYSTNNTLPVNNEQLVIINHTGDNWRIAHYLITDKHDNVYFSFAYNNPVLYPLLNAAGSMYLEVADIELDI